jgi:DNA-damage-inducible protein D
VDVVAVLTDSVDAGAYWRKLKERLKKEGNETVTNCHAFKMTAADGKQRLTDAADAEQLLRLIQSVPSPKAEPFKRWLARVGYERLQEIEDPELAAQRMREIYRRKGYSEAWIEKRMRGIAVRDELTGEWKKRGVKQQTEYAILTAEISQATFGMTPAQYRDHKALTEPGDNLRDHMTDLELIFTARRGLHHRNRPQHRRSRLSPKPARRQAGRQGGRQRPQGPGEEKRTQGLHPGELQADHRKPPPHVKKRRRRRMNLTEPARESNHHLSHLKPIKQTFSPSLFPLVPWCLNSLPLPTRNEKQETRNFFLDTEPLRDILAEK